MILRPLHRARWSGSVCRFDALIQLDDTLYRLPGTYTTAVAADRTAQQFATTMKEACLKMLRRGAASGTEPASRPLTLEGLQRFINR